MTSDISDRAVMCEEQGRRVLVSEGTQRWVLTIVHVIDIGDRHELRLVNRDAKSGQPDLLLTPKMWQAMTPVLAPKGENYRYTLSL